MNDTNSNGENWRNPDGTMKKGHPGIPGAGRKKKPTLEDFLKEGEDEELVKLFISQSKGNPVLMKVLIEYLLGKPEENHNVAGEMLIRIAKEIADKNEANQRTIGNSQ